MDEVTSQFGNPKDVAPYGCIIPQMGHPKGEGTPKTWHLMDGVTPQFGNPKDLTPHGWGHPTEGTPQRLGTPKT